MSTPCDPDEFTANGAVYFIDLAYIEGYLKRWSLFSYVEECAHAKLLSHSSGIRVALCWSSWSNPPKWCVYVRNSDTLLSSAFFGNCLRLALDTNALPDATRADILSVLMLLKEALLKESVRRV